MKLRIVLAMSLTTLGSTALAADPNLGRNLAATCANCHGTGGHAIPGSGIDTLAGQDKTILLQKLTNFKAGIKPATIMHQIAKGYTDEQLDLISGYFAEQKRGR